MLEARSVCTADAPTRVNIRNVLARHSYKGLELQLESKIVSFYEKVASN
jgi:hypothetical protein